MTTKRSWNGAVGAGSQTFTPAEERKVVQAVLGHVGRARATSEEDLVGETGVAGRALRAILAKHDGIDFVLYNPGDKRLWACEYADEADRTTRGLRSRARKLTERSDRRDAIARNLPRIQGQFFGMFDDEPEDGGEEDL